MELQVGDVFKLQKGMTVYAEVPEKFVYSNCKTSDELTSTEVTIGEKYTTDPDIRPLVNKIARGVVKEFSKENIEIKLNKAVEFVKQNVPELKKEHFIINENEFVVIRTAFDGGGTGHGPHDVYPDGHHVFCKALKNGKYDKNGIEINFYQSGSFTCMIENIIPIRKMTMKLDFV